MDRRAFLTSSALAAGAAAAGGLVVPDGAAWAEKTNGPGRNGVSKARPKRGGSLTFGTTAEEQGFNASSARFDSVGVMYARTVFDPLAIVDVKGTWAPYLARSIAPNADYTAWTITLRPTVLFHDGTPCNGAALLLNLQTYHTAFLTGIALKPVVQTIKQTGTLAVQMSFKYPWVSFPFYLAGGVGSQMAWVMAPSMINAKTGGTDNPVGTGPFKFTRWIPNTHFTATRWEKYWRKGLPYLDRITYKPIVDYTSRADALESGTIDMMITDVPQNIVVYRGKQQWSYVDDTGQVVGEPTMTCLLLNLSKPPFDTPTVRLAAAKSVTRAAYARIIDLGVNPVSTGLFVKGTPYYSKTSLPTYDPSHAKELVRQVARKTGKPVTFQLGSINASSTERAATYVQQKLEQVGFKVTKAVIQQNELIDNALKGDFDAYVWRQFGAVNPDLNYIFWSTTTITTTLSINMARNDDPRVQTQLMVGRSSTTARARVKAYQKINEYFAQDLPYLWADRAVWAVVAHPTVQNFNNPTTPSGAKAYGFIGGTIWPTQIWRS
ncbi:MAG: ABC transporter substrate-binding protein [Acidimicrobiales bacterium]